MRRTEKTIGMVVLVLIVAVAIFCVVTAILANQHDVSFIEEIKSWFETASEVVPEEPEASTSCVNLLKIHF